MTDAISSPLASLPAPASHQVNARDIADAAPGLIHGVYVRCDAPVAGDEPVPGLPWPPATVYDLRDPGESGGSHPLAGVSEVHAVPVFGDAAITSLMDGSRTVSLEAMYAEIIASPAAERIVGVVRGIATDAGPVWVHCSAGKDRAGITAALVLALVGAPRAAVVADYTATAANMPGVMARFLRTMPPEMLAMARESGVTGGGDTANELLGAPANAIESVLDAWDAFEGDTGSGVEGWFLAHGGDAETLGALRDRLVAR